MKTNRQDERENFASPRNLGYFKDEFHDRLFRCKGCDLKYDYTALVEFGGHWICKFCIKDMEVNGVHNQ